MKSLGPRQLAECMRSGVKCLASELVRDGRNPNLWVLPRYADPAHPQEKPYRPDSGEGRPRFPLAPDHGDDVAPVLSLPTGQTTSFAAVLTTGPAGPAPGFADEIETGSTAEGAFVPSTLFGLHVATFAFINVASKYIIGLDSGVPGVPPSVDAFGVIQFTDNLGLVTLVGSEAADSFVGGGPGYDSRRYWRFARTYPPGSPPLSGETDYTIDAVTANVEDPALSWTPAETIGPRVEAYRISRAIGSGDFAQLTELAVEFGSAPDYAEVHPDTYVDQTAELGVTYRYRVDAVTDDARRLESNEVTVTTAVPAPSDGFRLLEDSSFRLLEDGSFRLLEI